MGFTRKGAGDEEQGEGRHAVRERVCARVIATLTTASSENGAPCLQLENGRQNKLALTLHGR